MLLELDELVEREVELEELRAHHLIGERVALVVRLRLRQHEGHVLKVTTNVLAQLFMQGEQNLECVTCTSPNKIRTKLEFAMSIAFL